MNLYKEMQQWILHAPLQQKLFVGLLYSGNFLDMHRRVWFDNCLNSVELLLDTYGAGTVRIGKTFLKLLLANM